MAGQSKLPFPRERTVRGIVSNLTSLYLSHRTRISRAVWITLFVALANRIRHAVSEQKAASHRDVAQREARKGTTSTGLPESGEAPRKKVELNREFFRALLRLLRIVIPGWRSKETRLLISHSFFLVLRTLISVRVAEMDGAIVKALVKGKGKEFLKRIVWWMLIAVPATFTNSMVGSILSVPRCSSCGIVLLTVLEAVVSSSRAVPEVQGTANSTHSRQVPLQPHLLRYIRAGRPDKEPRSAHFCGRLQVLQ